MPYANSNRKNNRRRPYRRRRNKLADKKINTLIEKRIEEIARKEDEKNISYRRQAYCWPQNLAEPEYAGVSIIELADLLPTVNYSGVNASLNSLEYLNLTKFGQVDQAAAEYRVKQCQAFISLYNTNVDPYMVSAALIYIPNANAATAAASNDTGATNELVPRRNMLIKNNWRMSKSTSGMFHGFLESNKEQATTKHTILDRKTVVVPPASVNSDSDNSNPKRVIQIKLNKVYKNYKIFKRNDSSTSSAVPSQDGNIYLCVCTNKGAASTTDSGIRIQAIGGIKYQQYTPAIGPTVTYETPE